MGDAVIVIGFMVFVGFLVDRILTHLEEMNDKLTETESLEKEKEKHEKSNIGGIGPRS